MHHSFYSIKKGSLTIKEYLFKVKHLSDGLTAVGSLVTEQKQVSIILAGLSIEYESIRVFTSATPISLDLLTKMLLDCETRQMAFLTDAPLNLNKGKGVKARSWSFGASHQLHGQRVSSPSFACSSVSHCCGSFSPSTSTSCQPSSQGSFFSPPDLTWYPDSRATNHITPDMSNLTAASPYTGTTRASMRNGDPIPIASVGSSTLLAGSRLLHLKSVLHVSTVCKNLLLVGQFARDNAVYFEFHPFLCFVKDIQTGNTLLVGHMYDGLYRLGKRDLDREQERTKYRDYWLKSLFQRTRHPYVRPYLGYGSDTEHT
ncbi:hypothetical protein J1N35_035009 [Gossypium stocksii]|uniref:Retrovirus-related Pol polyprotein from transposon TNT 1-94-like beta-barrel domain-containing protein n=1 Tax=Gossypium stocksii TaxID=47602 RepID=A0A9D3UUX0_9ROSI|nr:hypothetical protein J1N35_035009 [Gossypium stocksii]